MRIETLCTGDELLTGQTLDGNGAFLQTCLLERLGLRVSRSTVVGDEREELVEALQAASLRAQLLVVSGGLGPTVDDLTVACAAQAAGVPLVFSPEVFQSIEARAQRLGFHLTEGAKKQALLPQGARHTLNALGSAPMVHMHIGRCEVFLLPGVPREFRAFMEGPLLQHLEAHLPPPSGGGRIFRKLYRLQCIGLPESLLDEAMAPIAAAFPEIKLGFRVRFPTVEVKFLCEASGEGALAELGEGVVGKARKALGVVAYGEGEATLAGVVVELLWGRGETVALAESCTGGHVAAELTAVGGASRCLVGGVVAYTAKAKRIWGGLSEEVLGVQGEVSAETTRLLAQGVRGCLGTHWGLAVTGYADGGQAGHFFVACAGPGGVLREEKVVWPGARVDIQRMAAARALNMLRLCLLGAPEGA
ncbi:MAG: CinA family nicotinamide mononucleotide deamidase-related protein [Cystobacterineae bacterium]|nr:CinA family nicotinamide mononucleotide deamidase-related protein [Cystobacterineae bacterium]